MIKSAALILTMLFASMVNAAGGSPPIVIANFSNSSEQQLKATWQPYNFSLFGTKTNYQLITLRGKQALRATSKGGVSGLIRKFAINLEEYPILSWRWLATNLPNQADDVSKNGDDHSLRLYVIFNSPDTSLLGWLKNSTGLAKTHALNYIWANQAANNSFLSSPYTERSVMIAVNSGEAQLGQWQSISRDVYADYHRAFGQKPPPVSAIAIMTDGDNTGSSLLSYYGDIVFLAE